MMAASPSTRPPIWRGQSIRALVQARSNPKIMVAGTLKGVYQSDDSGVHWKQISPAGSGEIHEVESIAIDPVDPKIIYAGTWHLPGRRPTAGQTGATSRRSKASSTTPTSSRSSSIPSSPRSSTPVPARESTRARPAARSSVSSKAFLIPRRRTRVLMQDPVNAATVLRGHDRGSLSDDKCRDELAAAYGSRRDHQ